MVHIVSYADIVFEGHRQYYMPIAREWRKDRQRQHDILNKEACERHWVIQRAEAVQLLWDLLHEPEVWTFPHYPSHILIRLA